MISHRFSHRIAEKQTFREFPRQVETIEVGRCDECAKNMIFETMITVLSNFQYRKCEASKLTEIILLRIKKSYIHVVHGMAAFSYNGFFHIVH